MADTQEKCSKYKKKDEGCPPASEFRSFLPEKVDGEGGKEEKVKEQQQQKHLKK